MIPFVLLCQVFILLHFFSNICGRRTIIKKPRAYIILSRRTKYQPDFIDFFPHKVPFSILSFLCLLLDRAEPSPVGPPRASYIVRYPIYHTQSLSTRKGGLTYTDPREKPRVTAPQSAPRRRGEDALRIPLAPFSHIRPSERASALSL